MYEYDMTSLLSTMLSLARGGSSKSSLGVCTLSRLRNVLPYVRHCGVVGGAGLRTKSCSNEFNSVSGI
jgi:hypothetical protein